jgi:hypothetical protein
MEQSESDKGSMTFLITVEGEEVAENFSLSEDVDRNEYNEGRAIKDNAIQIMYSPR